MTPYESYVAFCERVQVIPQREELWEMQSAAPPSTNGMGVSYRTLLHQDRNERRKRSVSQS